MIEREGREDAVPNSNSADSSTLPSKGSAAQECCSVCEALLDHLWLLCGGSFAFCCFMGTGGGCTWLSSAGGSPLAVDS